MTRIAKTLTALATAFALVLPAPAVLAQDDSFNIPENFTFQSSADPNVRHATVRVNGNIITGTDVDHRVALWVAANRVQLPEGEMQRLRMQVLRNLIDETLQVQEAAAQQMTVTAQEVDEQYRQSAVEQFNRTPEQMDDWLQSIGSSARSFKRQIQGELAWMRLRQRNISPFVNISAAEVSELQQQLEASRGTEQYRIGEIYLAATPATRDQVLANAQQIVQQLQQGGSFEAYARQFSDASTAAVGGDLGWIQLTQLQNPALETAASQMSPGQLAGPLEIPGGYSLLLLIDKRQVGMADPRDAVLSLKQISYDFPDGTSESKAQTLAGSFETMVDSINGCGGANSVATAFGASVVDADQPARQLPEALQNVLLQLNVGQRTPVFGALDEGVRVLMLCGRDDPQVAQGPSFDQLMTGLRNDRIERRSQRYMRDLRRDAVIEYN